MTDEQTIDAIMDAVLTSQDSAFRRGDGPEGYEESVAADQHVRDLIAAALAAKDSEIERLRAELAEIEAQAPVEWQVRFSEDEIWIQCGRDDCEMLARDIAAGIAADGSEARALYTGPDHGPFCAVTAARPAAKSRTRW